MTDTRLVYDAYGRPRPVKGSDLYLYGLDPDGTVSGTVPAVAASSSIRAVKMDIDPVVIWAACLAGSPYVELFQPSAGEQVIDLYIASYTLSDWGAFAGLVVKSPSKFQTATMDLTSNTKSGIAMKSTMVTDASFNAYDTSAPSFLRGFPAGEPVVASFDDNTSVSCFIPAWEASTVIASGTWRLFTSAGLVVTNSGGGTTGEAEPDWSVLTVGDSLTDGGITWTLQMSTPVGGALSVVAVVASSPEQVYP